MSSSHPSRLIRLSSGEGNKEMSSYRRGWVSEDFRQMKKDSSPSFRRLKLARDSGKRAKFKRLFKIFGDVYFEWISEMGSCYDLYFIQCIFFKVHFEIWYVEYEKLLYSMCDLNCGKMLKIRLHTEYLNFAKIFSF